MSTAVLRTNAGTSEVLTGRVSLPREGAWTAHLELGEEQAPAGAVVLELGREGAAPVTFSGTVDHGDTWQGRQRIFIVAGAGAFGITTPALLGFREWVGRSPIPVADLVAELVDAAGEQLAAGVLAALEGLTVPRWMRPEGIPASRALTRLVRRVGLSWRVLDSGEVWVGRETWPAIPDGAASFLEERDGDLVEDRAAPDGATLRPGTVVLGRQLHRVTYTIGEGAPRARLLGRSDRDDFAAAVRAVSRPDPLAVLYAATVVAQRADGTLDLHVDDDAIVELRAVPYRSFTGAHETIPAGTELLLAFVGGREDRPVAWGQVQDVNATRSVVRVGDAVLCGDLAVVAPPGTAGGPCTLTWTPAEPPGVPVTGTSISIAGLAHTGSEEVKIR